jgi:hypothetical protein
MDYGLPLGAACRLRHKHIDNATERHLHLCQILPTELCHTPIIESKYQRGDFLWL